MNCECKEWKENIDKLNAGFVFLSTRGVGGYTGKQFNFCPWCGKKFPKEKQ